MVGAGQSPPDGKPCGVKDQLPPSRTTADIISENCRAHSAPPRKLSRRPPSCKSPIPPSLAPMPTGGVCPRHHPLREGRGGRGRVGVCLPITRHHHPAPSAEKRRQTNENGVGARGTPRTHQRTGAGGEARGTHQPRRTTETGNEPPGGTRGHREPFSRVSRDYRRNGGNGSPSGDHFTFGAVSNRGIKHTFFRRVKSLVARLAEYSNEKYSKKYSVACCSPLPFNAILSDQPRNAKSAFYP